MPLPQIGIQAIADMSQFEAGMSQFDRRLATSEAATTRFASQTVQSFIRFGQGIAATLAGVGLTRLSQDLAMTAARTQTLGIVMLEVGHNVGFTTTELAIQEENIKKLGITTQVARSSLSRMMQSQLDVTQATRLARVAQDAAVIANVNSSEAFERILHAVTTLQPEILRNLGIVVNMQLAYEEFAKTQGVSADSITTTQKQAIALNETIKQGALIAGTYERAMETPGKALTSLERHIEEAKNALGEALLPAMKTGIDIATEFFKALQNLPGPLKAAAAGITLTGGVIGQIIGPLEILASLWAGLKSAAAFAAISEAAAIPGRIAATGSIAAQTIALEAQSGAIGRNTALWIANSSGVVVGSRVIGAAGSQIGGAVAATTGLGAALGGLVPVLIAVGAAAAGIGLTLVARDMINTSEGARLATKSVKELSKELATLRAESQQPIPLTMYELISTGLTKILGIDVETKMERVREQLLGTSEFVERALTKQEGSQKKVIRSSVDLGTTYGRLIQLQEEYNAAAEKELPSIVERLQIGAQLIPGKAAEFQMALEEIAVRGSDAIAKSAMDQMTEAQQKAIRENIPKIVEQLQSAIVSAEAQGLADIAATARARLEAIQGGPLARAFDVRPRVTVGAILNPEIEAQTVRLANEEKGLQDQARATSRELDQLGLASDRLSIQQMRLGLSVSAAEKSFRDAQETVRRTTDQLNEAQQRLQDFASAPLIGMKALDDQLFDTSQAAAELQLHMIEIGEGFSPGINAAKREALELKLAILEAGDAIQATLMALNATANQLQGQILGIQLGFAPEIGAARKEVLQLRLAMLEAGEATKTMFQFDLADMQRRELREGVPVARQIFEEIKRVQKGEGAEAKTPQQKQLEEAEKNLQKLELKQQLALIDLQTQSEIVGMQQRQVELSAAATTELRNRLREVERELELQETRKQLALFDLQMESEAVNTEQQRLNLVKQLTFEKPLRELRDMVNVTKEITFKEASEGIQQAQQDIDRLTDELAAANQVLADRQAVVESLRQAQEDLATQSQLNRIAQAEYNLALSETRIQFGLLREEIEASVQVQKDVLGKSLEDLRKTIKDNPILFDIGTKPPSPVDVTVRSQIGGGEIGPQEWAGFAGNPPTGGSLQDIASILNPITSAFESLFSSVKGSLGFKYGGVVPGPPGSPQLVMAHGGERFMSNNSNWNVTIHQNYPSQNIVDQLRREAHMLRLTRG